MRLLAICLAIALPLHASVIGVSKPAESLTTTRIMALPAAQRAPWLAYLRRSDAQKAADKAALAAERVGLKDIPSLPPTSHSAVSIPLHRDPAFYKSHTALHIAATILSYQIPNGGWSKNLDMTGPSRLPGQSYTASNLAPTPESEGDFDKPQDPNWHYVGTLDNDATNTELHFLAAMSAAWPGPEGAAYRKGFLRGIDYLLHAQYPNGGWPQVWPLEGGYHDAITFNDDAVTESAESLTLAAAAKQTDGEDYTFIPPPIRARARIAADKARAIILATQIHIDGTLTIWAQQHDPLTLAPVSGRNFEPAALSAGESASVMLYLITLPHPSPAVIASIAAAAAWFNAHKITGYTWSGGRSTPGGRKLTAAPGAGPIWARYYSLTTQQPVFGDRDKTIHDDVMELSLERRNGYGWYGQEPAQALTEYAAWKSRTLDHKHPNNHAPE